MIETAEYKINSSTFFVAKYDDQVELTIMTEIGKGAYNHFVMYMKPKEFKGLVKACSGLLGDA